MNISVKEYKEMSFLFRLHLSEKVAIGYLSYFFKNICTSPKTTRHFVEKLQQSTHNIDSMYLFDDFKNTESVQPPEISRLSYRKDVIISRTITHKEYKATYYKEWSEKTRKASTLIKAKIQDLDLSSTKTTKNYLFHKCCIELISNSLYGYVEAAALYHPDKKRKEVIKEYSQIYLGFFDDIAYNFLTRLLNRYES